MARKPTAPNRPKTGKPTTTSNMKQTILLVIVFFMAFGLVTYGITSLMGRGFSGKPQSDAPAERIARLTTDPETGSRLLYSADDEPTPQESGDPTFDPNLITPPSPPKGRTRPLNAGEESEAATRKPSMTGKESLTGNVRPDGKPKPAPKPAPRPTITDPGPASPEPAGDEKKPTKPVSGDPLSVRPSASLPTVPIDNQESTGSVEMPVSEPEPTPQPAPEPEPTPEPTPQPAPVQKPEPAPRTASAEPAGPITGSMSRDEAPYLLQLMAFRSRQTAIRQAESIQPVFPDIFIVKADLGEKGVWYRLRCCGAGSFAEATEYRDAAKASTKLQPIIVKSR